MLAQFSGGFRALVNDVKAAYATQRKVGMEVLSGRLFATACLSWLEIILKRPFTGFKCYMRLGVSQANRYDAIHPF